MKERSSFREGVKFGQRILRSPDLRCRMDTLSTEFQTSFFFQDYSTQVVETEVIINSPLFNVVLFTFDTIFFNKNILQNSSYYYYSC